MGLRYDLFTALTERYNRQSDFLLGAGTLALAGQNGYSTSILDTQKHNFSPRVGLAYRIGEKTVVRAAYGLSGVYDLAPLIGTSLNQALYLSAGISRAASPMFRPAPAKGRRFVAADGGDESAEFLRQSR